MASSQDAIVQAFLLNNSEKQQAQQNLETAFQDFQERPITDRPSGSYGEDFVRGANQGLNALSADLEYFKALGNTLIGREEAAEANIEAAELDTRESEFAVQGMETFEQFINEPTIDGFFSQVFSGLGQVSPFLVETVATAMVGGVAGVGAKAVMTAGEKAVAKKLIKETLQKKAEGKVLDATEDAVLQGAYSTLRANRFGTGMDTGAKVGAVGGTYPINTGESFKEFDEAGVDLDIDRAVQSVLLGGVSTAVEVGGESLFLKNLASLAKRKADPTNPSSLLNLFANNVGRGAAKGFALEGVTETTQEGLLVAQRMSVDDNYSSDEAFLRLGQAAFLGAIAGGAPGGVGGAIATAPEAVSRVFDKANDLAKKARDGQVSAEVDNEVFGDINSIYTTPEPEADIQAQFDAMFDPDSAKNAVWIAGRQEKAGPVDINGRTAYAASVKGRGTIYSTDPEIVNNVARQNASDESLAEALGYSAPKSAQNPGDLVVQALDKNGRVISEEVTDQAGLEMATAAATEIAGRTGSIKTVSVEQALADRKARKGPTIRSMEIDDDVDMQMDDIDPNEQSMTDPNEMVTVEDQAVDLKNLLDKKNKNRYKRRQNPTDTYESTAEARQRYQEVVSPRKYIDWNRSKEGFLSDAILKEAVRIQEQNPDVIVDVDFNPDGTHSITATAAPTQQLYTIQDRGGRQRKVTLEAFVGESVAAARASKFASPSTRLIDTNSGEVFNINLSDIVNAGKRINEAEITGSFEGVTDAEGAQAGLTAMMAALAERGYVLEVDGAPIQDRSRKKGEAGKLPDSYKNIVADAGTNVSLFDALTASVPRSTSGADISNRSIEEQAAREDSRSNPTEYYEKTLEDSKTPLSSLNIQDGALGFEARDRIDVVFPISPDSSKKTRAREFFPTAVKQVLSNEVKRMRLKKAVSFYALSDLMNEDVDGVQDPLDTLFSDTAVRNKVRDVLYGNPDTGMQSLIDSTTSYGVHMGFADAHVIILNDKLIETKYKTLKGKGEELPGLKDRAQDEKKLQAAMLLTASHELGHAVFEENKATLLNDPRWENLRINLLRNFEKARNEQDAPKQYLNPDIGFDEYLADQFAIYVQRKLRDGKVDSQIPANQRGRLQVFFKQIYSQIKAGFSYLSQQMRTRFDEGKQVPGFGFFIDEVVKANKRNTRQNMQAGLAASFEEKVVVASLEDAVKRSLPKEAFARLEKNYPRMYKALVKGGAQLFLPAATQLRRLGSDRGIGAKLAKMMYGRSYEKGLKGLLGFIQNKTISQNRWRNRLEPILEDITDSDLRAAESSTPTAELTGKAREIREFLNQFYDEYISQNPLTNIGRRADFFPVSLSIEGIRNNPEAFVNIIVSEDPTADPEVINKTVRAMLDADARNAGVVTTGQEIEGTQNEEEGFDNTSKDFLSTVQRTIDLTKNVRRESLAEAGFLNPPDVTLVHYVDRVTKKVEWDKATKGGKDTLKSLLEQLDPEERARAQKIINTFLGVDIPKLSPTMQSISSVLQLTQMLTTLTFAAVASIPELATAIIFTREFSEVGNGIRTVLDTFQNRKEAEAFAKEIGVVTSESMTNAFMSELDTHFMSSTTRSIASGYFKITGLTWFTQFTRMFSARLGKNFIIKHAMEPTENSARFLEELNLTPEDVKAWVDGSEDFNTPEGQKVRDALAKFVESTMLRPNAAERPVWASDPRYALLWQLKSFPYSYGQVVVGGVMRELRKRKGLSESESQAVSEMTAFLATAGLAILPFAMLSMELKESLKYLLQAVLPGVERNRSVFRTDRMGALEYLGAAYSSAGVLGPLSLATSFWEDASNLKFPNYAFGPTVDTAYQLVANQDFGRLLPVYNQID